METIRAVAALTNFDVRTKDLKAGIVKESRQKCNLEFLVHFYVDFYHVLVRLIICTRGGVLENNIIVDTRQASRLESLVCANFELRQSSVSALVASSIGKTEGMKREESVHLVRAALQAIVERAHKEPRSVVRLIERVGWSSGTAVRISRGVVKETILPPLQ